MTPPPPPSIPEVEVCFEVDVEEQLEVSLFLLHGGSGHATRLVRDRSDTSVLDLRHAWEARGSHVPL